ncbi:MAG: hypothetical protein Q4D45_10690 [Lachnospiraceae bacterium]|nr:hypothetical protein [Lachnospiraceae bacterium]
MENQNNHKRVPVLGIVVDSVSVPRAVEISKDYLKNDYFNVILLAGAWLAIESQESEEIKQFIHIADLILPGDHNIEDAADKSIEGMFQEEFLDQILMYLAKQEGHLCVLCDSEQQSERVILHLQEDYPGLKVDGVVFADTDIEAMEALVNTVNGYFPDLVLPLVSIEKQVSLLLKHKDTLSTKLYIGSENLAERIFRKGDSEKDDSIIVKWLKKHLHIGKKAMDNEFWQKYRAQKENNE